MARTFIRQDTQIRKSDLYDDTVTPSLANYETNPTTIEGDLNSLRSQVQNILNRNGASFPAGDWYSDMTAPSTFEGGIKRGVDTLNQELHDLERKRVLVCTFSLIDVVVPAAVAATGTLTLTANAGNTETVTTGTKTYTFQTTLTNVDGNVLIGATASDTIDNLIAAITLGAGAGTLYAALTTANGFVTAAAGAGDTMDATALVAGTVGNTYATTETLANGSWGAATLVGGTGDAKVLLLGELPSNTTAAIGAVTTLGTVAANNAGFPNINLAEVAGSTAISPKNLAQIVDGSTRDPILSSGRRIYALFQTESATDGSTMTGTTPNRAMLSFVRINATGDDLELCPASDIAGKTVNYCSVTRKALESLTEQDFLTGAEVDIPSASTVTRQLGYDNQGTTPVDLTTNATLDLESAGIAWRIRDDLQANLFSIIEGSAGDTSEIEFGSDVDVFDNDAQLNDFLQGVRLDTGGQRINIGETAGLIESTSTNDLRILGAGELYLDDGNQTGSTWAQTAGIKLSDTTQEWDDFEAKYGEVSLLNAIVQGDERNPKTYSIVNTTVNEDTDVSLADGNVDVAFPDMSLGVFTTDYDVFLNGSLLRPGANAAANHDYYPGTTLVTAAQLKFEFKVKSGDVICVIPYA